MTTGAFAQSVDHEYNIRGWLTGINDPAEDFDDFFGMKLGYGDPSFMPSLFNENGESSMFATYNGNISAIASKASGQAAVGFVYDYDGLNRLTTAFLNSGTTMLPATNMMTYSYDKNGNIQTLTRKNSTLFENLSLPLLCGNQPTEECA